MSVPLTLKVFKGDAMVAAKDYDRDIIKIGRLASAHLCLDDDKVSRIHSVIEAPPTSSPAAEAQGIAVSMIVAEVDPIGGFVGESVSEPLLQGGILASVLAYLIHIDPWMALGAFVLFVPQFFFVPLMQAAVNRRAGARIRILRQLGINVIDQTKGHFRADDKRIDRNPQRGRSR